MDNIWQNALEYRLRRPFQLGKYFICCRSKKAKFNRDQMQSLLKAFNTVQCSSQIALSLVLKIQEFVIFWSSRYLTMKAEPQSIDSRANYLHHISTTNPEFKNPHWLFLTGSSSRGSKSYSLEYFAIFFRPIFEIYFQSSW